MAKGVDIVGLQEMHSSSLRSKVASVASDTIGVQTATKPSSGDKHMLSFPVIYNKTKLAVVGTGYKRLGSIPGLSDRYVVYTKFRVKSSNQTFYFADTHLPPSVEAGGKVSGNSSWIAAYKRMMPVVVSTMKSLKSDNIPLFLVGDFNVNYRRDKCSVSWFPCSSMHSVSMYSAFELSKLSGIPSSYGTHGTGSRLIDYVWAWKRSDTTVKSVSIISGGSGNGYNGSDHKPSLAKVTISTPTKSSTSTAGGNNTGTTGGTSNTGGTGTTGGGNNTGTTGGTGNTSNTVTLSGVVNFRDVAMLNSSVIKPNLLYRSARLKEATDSDITTLSSTLNGGSILDLREAATQKSLPDRPVPGVSHYSFPIDGAASASRYVSVYVNNATYRKQFNLAITHIANSSGPNLIHCTKGRDRTGWLVSMILYILGATDAQVREEYMYTLKAGLSVSVNTLNTGLDAARKNNDGSIMNYITSTDKGLGVSNDTIQKLRAKLGK
jgi:endonuclease/exonuclease/phosphatase family metal-dependent hydrolase